MPYEPQPEAPTADRIAALRATTGDPDEIAATLVDEAEAAFPGLWATAGFDRGGAISDYLSEIERSNA